MVEFIKIVGFLGSMAFGVFLLAFAIVLIVMIIRTPKEELRRMVYGPNDVFAKARRDILLSIHANCCKKKSSH